MEEIRTYKVGMKLKGRLTQLPDSQKIFGALTYLLGEYTTSENAGSFVADVKERKVFCSLSDMLPEGFLPVPQTWFLDRVDKSDGIAATQNGCIKRLSKDNIWTRMKSCK